MAELDEGILVLDYGSQYTLLIARRLREIGVYSEVWPCRDARLDQLDGAPARGMILSGGPGSVGAEGAPELPAGLLDLDVPVLGICYGMQLLADARGSVVEGTDSAEYGRTRIEIDRPGPLFAGFDAGETLDVWMSHGDSVREVPQGYELLASTERGLLAAIGDRRSALYGLQFHPEVTHTEEGSRILSNFAHDICGCGGDWQIEDFLDRSVERIRSRVGDGEEVICGLSGGVDSAVVAAMVDRAVGDRLRCVHIDNGLLRHRESETVRSVFEGHFGIDLEVVDARDAFVDALAGVTDPERKRSIIGEKFIRIFEETSENWPEVEYLAQGTLYPDVIESMSTRGPSDTIKSHHNVGGLPERLDFELVEPLRELFKDEVRALGRALGLPAEMVDRHPFPGPGLAVRIMGEVTRERLETVRRADHIFIEALRREDHYQNVWQAFAVLVPVETVGVMGDSRTYDQLVALRAVDSRDGMTADRSHLPLEFLGRVSDEIINRVDGVNRVVYDVSSKPPATIEWE